MTDDTQREPVDAPADLESDPRFEWRPGMRYHLDTRPGLAGYILDNDHARLIGSESRWRFDLDDVGNHGHLLALVRKAWGMDHEITVFIGESGAVIEVRDPDGVWVAAIPRQPYGQALAAALRGAPVPP